MKKFNLFRLLATLGMFGMFIDGEDGGGSSGEDGGDAPAFGEEGGDAPAFGEEGYMYAGKYKTTQELENAYTEQQSHFNTKLTEANERFGAFTGAPEGDYTLDEGIEGFSEPVMNAINKWGKENNLSQESYSEIIKTIQETAANERDEFVAAEMEKMGSDAKARLQNINDKWAVQFGQESVETLQGKIVTAEDAKFYESILAKLSDPSVNPDGGDAHAGNVITTEELDAAMFKLDSAGNLKTLSDPEYKKQVEELTAKYNKQRGIQ